MSETFDTKALPALTEDDFNQIELEASKAMREWERGYVCQDVNVRHHISWWIMQVTYGRLVSRIMRLEAALEKIATKADDNLPMYTPCAMVHTAEMALRRGDAA